MSSIMRYMLPFSLHGQPLVATRLAHCMVLPVQLSPHNGAGPRAHLRLTSKGEQFDTHLLVSARTHDDQS